MAATEESVRLRLIEARLRTWNQRMRVTRASPEERERGENLSQLAAETPGVLTGIDAGITDIVNGLARLGIAGTAALNEWTLTPSGTKFKDVFPIFADISMEDYERLSQEHANAQELFQELAKRKPSAQTAYILSTLGMLMTPVGRRPSRLAAEGATMRSEMIAGGAAGASMPSESIEQQLDQALFGTFGGGVIHQFGNVMSAGGRVFVGGRPATIQKTEDLIQAERDLNAVGLLTAAELRQGRSLGRIEGVLDNLPFIGIGSHREFQREAFQNAVNTIRVAFPDVSADDALALIRTTLQRNEDEAEDLFRLVGRSVSDDADMIEPIAYRERAYKLWQEEIAKVDRADPRTVEFLAAQAQVQSVDFNAAQRLSSDLGRRTRIAERAAQDPANTGIDAGRMKLLSLAHFKDMERWARTQGGDTLKLWDEAKEYWRLNVLPYQKRPLAPVFDEGYSSLEFARFLTNPTNAQNLAKLDETGALGFLLINDALEQSTVAGAVDVKKFIGLLGNRRRSQAIDELISPEAGELLIGLEKLVTAAPRAFIKPTQASVLGTTAGSAAAATGMIAISDDPTTAIATGFASLGAIRWLVTSRGGRNLLTIAAHTQPSNRRKLAQIAADARRLVQRASILAVTEGAEEAERVIPAIQERFAGEQPVQ